MDDFPELIAFMEEFVEMHRSRARETVVDEASLRFLEAVLADLRGVGEATARPAGWGRS